MAPHVFRILIYLYYYKSLRSYEITNTKKNFFFLSRLQVYEFVCARTTLTSKSLSKLRDGNNNYNLSTFRLCELSLTISQFRNVTQNNENENKI